MKKLSIYIHIPFCVKKCAYCDFVSFPFCGEASRAYEKALFAEINRYADLLGSRTVRTVFVGGGTPSLMTEAFHEKLLSRLADLSTFHESAEITLEANPESILARDVLRLSRAGYNRISLGVQSFDDRILKIIGRIHDSKQSRLAFEAAREGGFKNINIDLMYGLPGQTLKNWESDLKIAAEELAPEHISAYGLIVNEDTEMHRMLQKRPDLFPKEGKERRMHHLCTDYLQSRGYEQYEISNYAKKGRESIHNLAYWERQEYLGLGLGAHSFMDSVRFQNTAVLKEYVDSEKKDEPPVVEREMIEGREALFEQIFLGLRLTKGMDMDAVGDGHGMNFMDFFERPLKSLTASGLLSIDESRLRLTRRGMDVSNSIFLEFLKVIDQKY